MKKIYVYKASPSEEYIRGLAALKKQKKIDLEILTSAPFYYLLAKIYNHLPLKKKFQTEVPAKQLLRSFLAPFILPFTKNPIIIGISPYSYKILFPLFLKLLKKNIIYFNSWPYWFNKKAAVKPLPFAKSLWKLFLKNQKTVAITKKATKELNKAGAEAQHIPHPVDTELFKPKKSKKSIDILFVGRLIEEKGLIPLVIISKKLKLNTKFVGEGRLEPLIKKQGMLIKYKKDRKQLANLFNQSKMFVLNSYATKNWEELFGIVLIEAMASGLPVISTDCVGPKEIIDPKVGILIPQKNDKELEKAIKKLMKANREKMGKAARKKAVELYNIKKISEQWLKVFHK